MGQQLLLLGWGHREGNEPLELSLQHHEHLCNKERHFPPCKGEMKGFWGEARLGLTEGGLFVYPSKGRLPMTKQAF